VKTKVNASKKKKKGILPTLKNKSNVFNEVMSTRDLFEKHFPATQETDTYFCLYEKKTPIQQQNLYKRFVYYSRNKSPTANSETETA